jgi:hypothetical protein
MHMFAVLPLTYRVGQLGHKYNYVHYVVRSPALRARW